jgi:hypothetical protein
MENDVQLMLKGLFQTMRIKNNRYYDSMNTPRSECMMHEQLNNLTLRWMAKLSKTFSISRNSSSRYHVYVMRTDAWQCEQTFLAMWAQIH